MSVVMQVYFLRKIRNEKQLTNVLQRCNNIKKAFTFYILKVLNSCHSTILRNFQCFIPTLISKKQRELIRKDKKILLLSKQEVFMKEHDASEEKISGSLGLENKLQQEKRSYDARGKAVLLHKEVQANILKHSVPLYQNYSLAEIMDFIEEESISGEQNIAMDTDTRIKGENTVQTSANEANLTFDVLFRVSKPEQAKVHLHVDVELQGDYYPGYPLEKRGVYNLSRMISSQLDVVTRATNYSKLEKVYVIFICVGNVPKYACNTASYYELVNTKNIGIIEPKKENYDLLGMIIIRVGKELSGREEKIIHFLHGLFYDIEEVKEYIDFSQNKRLREEMSDMSLTGDHLVELGIEQGIEKGIEQGIKQERQNTIIAEKRAQEAEEEKQKLEQEVALLKKQLEQLTK